MNQPTDLELTNAMHVMRRFTVRQDNGTRAVKPGLEMLSADAGATLCQLRRRRTTWCGAGELQLRLTCDKFMAECGLGSNVELRGSPASGRVPLERRVR